MATKRTKGQKSRIGGLEVKFFSIVNMGLVAFVVAVAIGANGVAPPSPPGKFAQQNMSAYPLTTNLTTISMEPTSFVLYGCRHAQRYLLCPPLQAQT
jgi:hypothetical protein